MQAMAINLKHEFAAVLQQKLTQLLKMQYRPHLVFRVEANNVFFEKNTVHDANFESLLIKMETEVSLKLVLRDNIFLPYWVRTLTDQNFISEMSIFF